MGEVIDLKTGLSAEIVPLFVGSAAPENATPPRKEFGLRQPRIARLPGAFGEAWRRATEADDEAQQRQVKDNVRAARRAYEGSVHPSLLVALAAKMEAFAQAATQLEAEARSLGLNDEAMTFNNIASIVETRAAIVEASAP